MPGNEILLIVAPDGSVSGLYTEAVDLAALGPLEIRRASQVEFNPEVQAWEAVLPGGEVIARSPCRVEALARERATLQARLLSSLD